MRTSPIGLRAALGAALLVAAPAGTADAQKLLLYCPSTTNCDNIVNAVTNNTAPFTQRLYNAANIDRVTTAAQVSAAALANYDAFVVISAGATATDYTALTGANAAKLNGVLTGRVAVLSGAPDAGGLTTAKMQILRNLIGWARTRYSGGANTGLVVLQDMTLESPSSAPYSWLPAISQGVTLGLPHSNVKTSPSYSQLDAGTVTSENLGAEIFKNPLPAYTAMAGYGLVDKSTASTALGGKLSSKGQWITTKPNGTTDLNTGAEVLYMLDRAATSAVAATFTVSTPVAEGSAITLAFTAPSGGTGSYEYAVDCGSGTYGTASASATASCPTTDNGTLQIKGKIFSGTQSTEYTQSVTVTNVAPTATLVVTPAGDLTVGASFTVALTSPADPSSVDFGQLTYAFDCGTGSGYAAASTAASATCTAAAAGTQAVKAKVIDKDGGVTERTASPTVARAATSLVAAVATGSFGGTAPLSATLTANNAGVAGKTITFSLNGTSVGTATTNGSGVASLATASLAGINAGTYASGVSATFTQDASHEQSSGTAALTVNAATATITVTDPQPEYDGSAKAATIVTVPASLAKTVTYTLNNAAVANPTNAGTYSVAVASADPNYQGSATGTLTIRAAAQSISFAQGTPSDKTYGDGTFNVSANATSGLPVSLTASGSACTVSGATVTILAAGTCTLTASQPGGGNYAAATSVTHLLTVARAPAQVALSATTKVFNGSAQAPTVTTTPANLPVALTYDGNTGAPTNAGSYALAATVTDANYVGSASGTFTIERAPATISLGGLSRTYNGSAQGATVTVDPVGISGVTVTYDGSETAPTNAGSYAVVAALDNSNYVATNATGTLVIAKAGQTISISAPASKTFGDATFNVTATATSGLTAALTASGPCTLSSSGSVSITGAGNCVLAATQAGDANYNAAPNASHTIAIAKANQTLGFNLSALPTKTYGDPAFSVASFAAAGASDKPVTFASTTTDVCTVSAAGSVEIKTAGDCTVTASQLGNANYNDATPVSRTIGIFKAAGSLSYDGANYVETNLATISVPLRATLTRSSTAPAGAAITNARVRFNLRTLNGATPVATIGNVAVNASGVAEAALSAVRPSEDPYQIEVVVESGNAYWEATSGQGALQVVTITADRQVNGGGWVRDEASVNGKGSLAFMVNAKAGTTGSSLRGNALYIWRAVEGGVAYDYKFKSNSWQGGSVGFNIGTDAARAAFTGRGNLQKIDMNGNVVSSQGNLTFSVELLDGDLRTTKVTDQYGLTISDNGSVVRQTTLRVLGGGNVKVQSR